MDRIRRLELTWDQILKKPPGTCEAHGRPAVMWGIKKQADGTVTTHGICANCREPVDKGGELVSLPVQVDDSVIDRCDGDDR